MLNKMNMLISLFGIDLNQEMTSDELLCHWLTQIDHRYFH